MQRESPRRARWRTVFNTLLGEILLWLLIILLMAWSIGVVMIYNVANKIPNEPYDARLADHLQAVAAQIRADGGGVVVNLPLPARELLRADARDRVYFQVSDERGRLIAGDTEMPWIAAADNQPLDTVLFRDDELGGEDVRVAYIFKRVGLDTGIVLAQVAETLNKREAMAARVVSSVIVPQFAIVPLAILLIYVAVSRGITPLHHLQDELRDRRPADLRAISLRNIPAEIRPLLEALNDTMARLDESLAGQRRFIADAAHQLKTPLTGLRTQAELAMRETSPERLRACTAQMLTAIERLSDMTQKLLTLARAEAFSEQSAMFEDVDLAALVPEVAREQGPDAMQAGVDLAFELVGDSPDPPPGFARIRGSRLLLHELFANLIDNAIRYTPRGGSVVLRIRRNGRVVVEVDDTGVGIPSAERDKVFARFYRVLGSQADGSGLGLSIVREIADLHHAEVRVADGSRGGVLFSVSFRPASATT